MTSCSPRRAASAAQGLAAVGKALAVEQTGHAVGRGDQRRALLAFEPRSASC